ncbi:MAG: hypothetical protein ACO1TE_00010 [Prosthecobacter sp.]
MPRHFPCAALILGLSISHALVLGQEKSGWQTAVDTFEARGARLLLPVHQLLLSELEAATRQAEAAGDSQRKAELEAALLTARRDHAKLQSGRVPHADPAEVEKDAFLRAANGVQWALAGTRNLKRIGISNGTLHSFSEEGRDLGELSRQHVLPGMFGNRRNEGDGWSYYLISPALDLAHCVVTTQLSEGWLVGREDPPRPKTMPPPAPVPSPATAPKGRKEDLWVLLERKYRQQHLDHERRLVLLLKDRLADAAGGDRDAIDLRLQLARVALALGQVKHNAAPAPPESHAAFHERLRGCKWVMPRMRGGHRLIVADQRVQTLDAQGQPADSLPAETLWPGVLRARAPDGGLMMVVFSPDLTRLLTFPVRSQFPARRVQ